MMRFWSRRKCWRRRRWHPIDAQHEQAYAADMAGWINLIAVPALLALGQPPLQTIERQPPPADEAALINPVTGEIFDLATRRTRMTVNVRLGGNGPHAFLVDTGAQRTTISRQLAQSLGMLPGPNITLVSIGGLDLVPTVRVPNLQLGPTVGTGEIVAPALDFRHIGADGLLGVDALAGHRVVIDLDANQMTVTPSVGRIRRKRSVDEIIVEAKSVGGQLILTDAYYNDRPIRVVIDTGSAVSIGNDALRRRIRRNRTKLDFVEITNVMGNKIKADYSVVDRFELGPISFNNAVIAFSDGEPFHKLGLDDRPAMLLGMDLIRQFRRVDIDFPSRQVRFVMARGTPQNNPLRDHLPDQW